MKIIIGFLRFITCCAIFFMTNILTKSWFGDNFGAILIGWILGFIICCIVSVVESIVSDEPPQDETKTDKTDDNADDNE